VAKNTHQGWFEGYNQKKKLFFALLKALQKLGAAKLILSSSWVDL